MPILVINKVNEDQYTRTGNAFRNNALDTIKSTFTLELNARIDLSTSLQIIKNGDTFTLTDGNWSDLISAFNGATIDFVVGTGSIISTTVDFVDGVDITFVDSGNFSDGTYFVGFFQITSNPEQFEFSVNLVLNSVASGTASLIDSEVQRFSATLVNALNILGGTDDLTQLGNKSGGSQFTTKTISRLADAANGNKKYELIVIYKNWLCIEPDPYFAGDAVGDYYEFKAFMISGDPSVLVEGTTFQTGDTGFQDENFNGFPSDYTFVSIAWEDASSNVIDVFDFSQTSLFTIRIDGDFNPTDQYNIKMFTLPNDATEFSNKPNPVENNLILCSNATLVNDGVPTNITGNANDAGAKIDINNFEVTDNTTHIIITGEVVPNTEFTDLFESKDINDRRYKIWIQCGDSTTTFKQANTVNVLVEDDQSKEDILPLGLWPDVSTLEMEDHNTDVNEPVPDPYLEDDVLVNVEFTLPKDVVSNPWLSIRMRIVAEKTDGERFIIEETVYDTSSLPTNGTTGILPLDFTQNRGFKLPATSDKQDITVQLFPSLDTGSDFGVQVRYPFIVRYEDWLSLPQASDDFFGSKTQNWFQYSDDADWNVQFEMGLERANGEYINDIVFTIHDYDDWGEVPGSSISFKQLDDTPINKPFASVPVKVTATHEVDTEDWSGNEWAIIHVRPEFGSPQWLIGTVLDHSDLNNPLLPLSGETKGKITVGTKIVTIEAGFDPSKDIDVTGNVTFTTRISGNTTAGKRSNIFKETFTLAKSPKLPHLREDDTISEEDRGYKGCNDPFLVLADLNDLDRNKNDIESPRAFGDLVSFRLTKDGVVTTFVPTSIQFPNQPDAFYAIIEWRDVLISDGPGCYSIDIVSTVAGNIQPSINWGSFVLKPYAVDGYLHARYTARILSQFNDKNDFDGIDYTDSFLLSSVRIKQGKFGYFQPNTEIDIIEQLDGTNQKVHTEDFFDFELRVNGVTKCVVNQILVHLRGMTNCWMSSYNYDDFDYEDLSMKNVILSEGLVPEHIDGSRLINGVVKFKDKVFNKRSHFQDNRQTGEASQPPLIPVTAPPSATSTMVLKTNAQTSFRTGDDGDLQIGRGVDFFTLSADNIFGNTNRFTDELGIQSYVNDIIIDHESRDYANDKILGYYRVDRVALNWDDAIDTSLALSVGGFTSGWHLPNYNEMERLRPMEGATSSNPFQWVPLNLTFTGNFWTSTTREIATAQAHTFINNSGYGSNVQGKTTATNRHIYARVFTISGTTLT